MSEYPPTIYEFWTEKQGVSVQLHRVEDGPPFAIGPGKGSVLIFVGQDYLVLQGKGGKTMMLPFTMIFWSGA